MAHLAAEPELTEDGPASDRRSRDLLGCRKHPAGRGEVEAGTDLWHVRRREVDGDAALRERKAAVQQGGVHALARLANGRVATSDDREGRQTAAQVDLDGDAPGGESVDREGGHTGEHATAR